MKLLHLCVKKIKRGSKLHWQVIGVVGLLSLWRCEKWQMDAFKKLKSNCNFKTRTNNYQHLNLSKWLIRSRTGNSFQKHFFYNCWKLPNRQWLCVSTRRKTIFSSVYFFFFTESNACLTLRPYMYLCEEAYVNSDTLKVWCIYTN